MATAWKVAAATAVVGWWISPIITFLLPKIISSLGFDAKKKLRELQIHFIPELENTLRAVDQERMMQRGQKPKSVVSTLDDMAAMLRHARGDAEDIFDDAQHKVIVGNILSACVVRFNSTCVGIASIVRSSSARLLQNWFDEPVPVNIISVAASEQPSTVVTIDVAAASHEPIPTTTNTAAASEEQAVPVTAPSNLSYGSSGRWLSSLCSSFNVFKNLCTSIFFWLVHAIEGANSCRDNVLGIPSNQEDTIGLNFVLTAISTRNLKKRIEKVESTISDVKSSPLLGVASKIAPHEIANKNRSRIRTASNRKVFGREALRDSITAKLREKPHHTSPCYSAIGIYGVGGSGKTTFARYTRDYIEKECKEEKLFDTIMCIDVSETFSVDDIFHEMLKDITKDRHSGISDREDLEEKLKESLRGKRFFLILDDLWVKTKNDPQLEELISPLNVGKEGSKILVTARTKTAAGALCADEPMEMPDLDEDQYLSMFMHYALGGTSVAGDEFERVGRKIAEKLHQSPIAAVIVAGQLGANRDIRFWKTIQDHDMLNDTVDALWWSYQQLSLDIRRCFEYCNIFPRRFRMKQKDLVRLWIAQGFVKTNYTTEDIEAVAEGYIQELVSCSFLQQVDVDCFRIHDLLHDLVDMVTGSDYFRIENEGSQRGESWKDIPRDAQHMFVQNYDAKLITEKILGLKNLRTLIIGVVGRDTQVEEKIINCTYNKLPKLRVLDFSLSVAGNPIKELRKFSVPESVGQLKHLRYFAFRTDVGCKITLPSTLNKLRHIQFLDFGDGHILDFTFAELANLRHILCAQYMKLPYVGRLSSLQTLPGFRVISEQGCGLEQLKDLDKLRGKLWIGGLENVKSKAQALEANLASKRLTELSLFWDYSDHGRCDPEVEADVLEGLCPPVGLKKLTLSNFVGWRYPDWMVGKHNGGPMYLQELHLWECSQLGPASELAEAFPHLRVLGFFYCSWDALPDNMEHLTSLKELNIFWCFNILSLPTLPQSLEKIMLGQCNDEFMKSCQTAGHPNRKKIEHIPTKYLGGSSV